MICRLRVATDSTSRMSEIRIGVTIAIVYVLKAYKTYEEVVQENYMDMDYIESRDFVTATGS